MSVHIEAVIGLLVWEFLMGHQQVTKAKSTIALLILILTLAVVGLYNLTGREKNG